MSDGSGGETSALTAEQLARGSRRAAALRFAVAVALPGAIALSVARTWLRGRPLSVVTDIVGYPIHAAYNVYELFWRYRLAVLFFPAVALVLYHLLGRVWPGSHWPASAQREPPPAREPVGAVLVARQVARSLAVGATFGLGVSLLDGQGASQFWRHVGLSTFVYALVQLGIGALAAGRSRSASAFAAMSGRLNAIAAPFTLLSLYAASRATQVTVAGGSAHAYPWLPGSAVIAAASALALVQLWRLRGARELQEVRRIEAQGIVLVAGPVVLFLYTAQLPSALGGMDAFHFGEFLASAWLFEQGAFPWRDSIFIHGLLHDVFTALSGVRVFGDTAWGGLAGIPMFARPLWWVLHGLLFAYLFRRSPLLLLAALAGVLLGVFDAPHMRLAVLPPVLLSLAALLDRATWARAFLFAFILVGANVIVPEMAYAVPACGTVLVAFEASRWHRERTLVQNLPATLRACAAGMALVVAWFGFLAYHDAAASFLHYYATFAPGHALTGGIPIATAVKTEPKLVVYMLLPPTTVLLAFWYVVARIRGRRQMTLRDWTMAALALFTFLYYPKFLSRADLHVLHSAGPALPLAWYAVDKLSRYAGAIVGGRWPMAAAGLVALGAMVASVPGSVLAQLSRPSASFARVVPGAPVFDGLGWSEETLRSQAETWRDIGRFLDAYLEPGEPLFDFTNQPGVYHYLLRRPPATRYAHVSMAIRRDTQLDLIRELARTRPKLVVFGSPLGHGMPAWDSIANEVRHYEITRTILLEYRPFARVSGQIFLVRRDLALEAHAPLPPSVEFIDERDFLVDAPACDWGHAPFFLRTDGLAPGQELELLSPRTIQRVIATGWAVDEASRRPASGVVVFAGAEPLGQVTPTRPRPDVAAHLKAPAAERSGFSFEVVWAGEPVDLSELRAYALSSDGRASPLGASWTLEGRAPGRIEVDGRAVPIAPGTASGWLDQASAEMVTITPVMLPDDLRDVAGLELVIDASRRSTVTISDTRASAMALFKVLPGTTTVHRVRLDNCRGWHALQGRTLFLRLDAPARVRGVRPLLREPRVVD